MLSNYFAEIFIAHVKTFFDEKMKTKMFQNDEWRILCNLLDEMVGEF
jgi:hypothetical protein